MKPLALSCALCAALAGCAGAPAYHPPEVATPATWQASAPFRTASPGDAALKGSWWEVFGDEHLNRLEQQSLAHSQTLAQAAARLEQARAQAAVTTAGLFPQLGLQTGASRSKSSAERPPSAPGGATPSLVTNNFQAGFAVSYEADLFGRVRSSVQAARASAEQAAADFENVRLILSAELAADYFNLRELDAEIEVVLQGLALQQKAFDFIQARHELGAASGLDLAQQQSLLDASRTQLELLRSQRSQYEHAIATLTGTPAPSFQLAPALVTLTPPTLPIGAPSDLLQRRPDIAASERAVAAANAAIGVARAAYFPSLTLQANGGWDAAEMGKLFSAPSILWSLGGALTQNLFDGGKADASTAFAQAAYRGAVANYRQSVLTAMQEVEDGVTNLTQLGRAQALAEATVRSAQRVLDLANERYAGGVETYFDVITAQQTLLNNQRLLVQLRGKQMVSTVYLVKALGGGWRAPEQVAAR